MYHEYEHRTWYKVVAVNDGRDLTIEYDTYEEAYHDMCVYYCESLKRKRKPTRYKIMKYSWTNYGGRENTIVHPYWE